ncbi:hypothetical protein HPP92_022459 [Vanilla planifolia]|uniref:Isopenicillin N synthase-like Fe(2+) 2OG dioxygenase domain-containing protein n=1 Tax=Vanilla planifolia TaxID=51239 RepID=A0A835PWJ8_VANPL|nr:hypothetical protein HPP92_022459 [Vanilla planifolia]
MVKSFAILKICREKDKWPRQWEDVPQIYGAFIINVGDMLERWTNCLFRSTLHRVVATGKERYSLAFFLDPSSDCLVECLESCCSEACPPKFPPILSGDYLNERLRLTYSKSSSSGDLPSNASSPSSSTYLFQNQCSLHTVPICSSCSPFVSGNKKKINKVIPITQPAKKKKTPHFKWQRIHIMLCAVRTVNKKSAATAMLFPADLISKGKISLVSSNGSDPHENEYPNTKMTNSAINKRAHASLIIPWSPSSADITHPTATRELNNRAPPRRNKFRRPNRSTNGMAARFPTVPAVLITRVESNEVLSLRPIVRNNNGA